jgi:polysaccharide biosynthesis transport protein
VENFLSSPYARPTPDTLISSREYSDRGDLVYEERGNLPSGFVSGAVKRHPWVILGCVVLCAAAAYAGAGRLTSYQSTATVLVSPVAGAPFSSADAGVKANGLDTEAQLVETDDVAVLAIQKLGYSGSSVDLRAGLDVMVPPGTQVLTISYSSGQSAVTAQKTAQAFADSYLAYRRTRAITTVKNQLTAIAKQISVLDVGIAKDSGALAGLDTTSADYQVIKSRLDNNNALRTSLALKQSDLSAPVLDYGKVITPAGLPGAPRLSPPLISTAGAILGLFAGLLLALLRERRDDRIHDVKSLIQLGARPLALVPVSHRKTSEPIAASAPQSPAAEAYRRVRTAVITGVARHPATVVVASVTPGASSAVVSANLAVSMARAGSAVALVDANAFDDTVARLFDVPVDAPGLTEVLTGAERLGSVVRRTPIDGLELLTAGLVAHEMSERFLGLGMDHVIERLYDSFDVVVVAAPSAPTADGEALAAKGHYTVLTIEVGVATRAQLTEAAGSLGRLGVDRRGIVALRRRGFLARQWQRLLPHRRPESSAAESSAVSEPLTEPPAVARPTR